MAAKKTVEYRLPIDKEQESLFANSENRGSQDYKLNEKQEYITAVQAGMDRDYQPMEALFSEIIEKSISASVE